ncbi:unnamed protein product, partial [Pocillopora meandrina]
MSVSNFEDALNSSSKSVLFSPSIPQFEWDLKQTLSLQLTIGATAVACPWIISLNIWRSFYATLNRCRCAYSSRNCITSIIYFLSEIGVSFLITLYTISYHHLLLIAWERYVAIVKWTEYKVLVTQGRLKKYTVLFAVDLVINLGRLTETLTVVYFYSMLYIE